MTAGRFGRVFVANRGEIAVRIIRACKSLGIETVIGVSTADRDTLGARLADRAICIGPAAAKASYLNMNALVAAAQGTGCDAIHPGYGFLSERAAFQRLCVEAGIAFIGPSAHAIEKMGDKITAISMAKRAGVPIVPGKERISSAVELLEAINEVGLPCLIKATAGGGGRGMRVVRELGSATAAFKSAQAEALAAFGDGTLYLEKYISRARHIEIQVIADHHGNACHLFERDCTVQRRHQKLIEEAPSVVLAPATRTAMAVAALALTRAAGYTNAGTVEFVYDIDSDRFYFLEMNTRVQVEHPVTEMITGIDIVREQIMIAAGERLSFSQDQVKIDGVAIECRINAEDAARDFQPMPGLITGWSPPEQADVRLDTHCYAGYRVTPFYDSMIAKVIVHAPTREAAIERMDRYLAEFHVQGITTTIPFQRRVITHRSFAAAQVTTTWVENELLRETAETA